jgi:hypothetical protein
MFLNPSSTDCSSNSSDCLDSDWAHVHVAAGRTAMAPVLTRPSVAVASLRAQSLPVLLPLHTQPHQPFSVLPTTVESFPEVVPVALKNRSQVSCSYTMAPRPTLSRQLLPYFFATHWLSPVSLIPVPEPVIHTTLVPAALCRGRRVLLAATSLFSETLPILRNGSIH